jgi:hypothetical protein
VDAESIHVRFQPNELGLGRLVKIVGKKNDIDICAPCVRMNTGTS